MIEKKKHPGEVSDKNLSQSRQGEVPASDSLYDFFMFENKIIFFPMSVSTFYKCQFFEKTFIKKKQKASNWY